VKLEEWAALAAQWGSEDSKPCEPFELCPHSVVLWPDVEQIDIHCVLPAGHNARCIADDGSHWDHTVGVESYEWEARQ